MGIAGWLVAGVPAHGGRPGAQGDLGLRARAAGLVVIRERPALADVLARRATLVPALLWYAHAASVLIGGRRLAGVGRQRRRSGSGARPRGAASPARRSDTSSGSWGSGRSRRSGRRSRWSGSWSSARQGRSRRLWSSGGPRRWPRWRSSRRSCTTSTTGWPSLRSWPRAWDWPWPRWRSGARRGRPRPSVLGLAPDRAGRRLLGLDLADARRSGGRSTRRPRPCGGTSRPTPGSSRPRRCSSRPTAAGAGSSSPTPAARRAAREWRAAATGRRGRGGRRADRARRVLPAQRGPLLRRRGARRDRPAASGLARSGPHADTTS